MSDDRRHSQQRNDSDRSQNPFGFGGVFDSNGTVLSDEEREKRAKKLGLCAICGIKTHERNRVTTKMKKLTNDNVSDGICIRCNRDLVPPIVYSEWKRRSQICISPSQRPKSKVELDFHDSTISEITESEDLTGTSMYLSTDRRRGTTIQTIPSIFNVTGNALTGNALTGNALLTVFQASPLAYEDFTGRENSIQCLDLDTEATVLREALGGTGIDVAFRTATSKNLGLFLSKGNGLLHLSCHGHPKYLFIEDDHGGAQRLLVDENLKSWIKAGGNRLSFVFISACHSRSAGEAFVEAGVQHVVCCEQDGQMLSNTAAMVFSRDFYRALANGRTIQESFDLAVHAVKQSPELGRRSGVDAKQEAEKFALLPEQTNHKLAIFNGSSSRDSTIPIPRKSETSMIPVPPQVFLGREVEMYRALKTLFVKKSRLMRITGVDGIGKASFAKALGHYIEKRKMFGDMFWFPSTRKGKGKNDIIGLWYQLFLLLEDSHILPTQLKSEETYRSVSENILDNLYDKKAIIIMDPKEFSNEAVSKICIFLDDLFERTRHVKVIVVCKNGIPPIQSTRPHGFPCSETKTCLSPLDFALTVDLFGRVCQHAVSSKNWSKKALFRKKSDQTFKILGKGIPGNTLLIAKNMTEHEYEKLVANTDRIHESDFEETISMVNKSISIFDSADLDNDAISSAADTDMREGSNRSLKERDWNDEVETSRSKPPLRSQAEVQSRFAPLLRKEGKVYRKNVTGYIRKAKKGEHVVTTIDGKVETQYKVNRDDMWVVCGRAGEYYCLSEEEFQYNYDEASKRPILPSNDAQLIRLRQNGFEEYRSRRQVWARKVDENDLIFFRHGAPSTTAGGEAYFVAPWGESMRVEQGDFLVMQYPGGNEEIYRIECIVFQSSYASDDDLGKAGTFSWLVTVSAAVLVGVVIGMYQTVSAAVLVGVVIGMCQALRYASEELQNYKDVILEAKTLRDNRDLQQQQEGGGGGNDFVSVNFILCDTPARLVQPTPIRERKRRKLSQQQHEGNNEGGSDHDDDTTFYGDIVSNDDTISYDDVPFYTLAEIDSTHFVDLLQENSSKRLKSDLEFVLNSVVKKGVTLKYACEEFKNDKDIVLLAVYNQGEAIRYASESLQADKDIVLLAIQKSREAIRYASESLLADKDIVLMAISKGALKLEDVQEDFKADKDVVLQAIQKSPYALHFASEALKNDEEIVLAAIQKSPYALEFASEASKADRKIVLEAIQKSPYALHFASEALKGDEEIVLAAIQKSPFALQFASEAVKDNKKIVLAAFQQDPDALEFASDALKADEKIVLEAVRKDGLTLRFAHDTLKADKDIVLAAVSNEPEALKFALGGLNQDSDCWAAAKLWNLGGTKLVALSTRFALKEQSTSSVLQFEYFVHNTPYFRGHFNIYSPNFFNKTSCDPNWTTMEWPCRGTYETCEVQPESHKVGKPTDDSCWRYSYRYHLEEAKRTNGFMLQIIDFDIESQQFVPGKGQQIETVMAQKVGTKIFRICQPCSIYIDDLEDECICGGEFTDIAIAELVRLIQDWYSGGCVDNSLVEIQFRSQMSFDYESDDDEGWEISVRKFDVGDNHVDCISAEVIRSHFN